MKDSEIYSEDELEQEKAFFKQVDINTIEQKAKKKSLNIRLYEDDIEKIKAIALNEGLPYQTFLSSMIHKLAVGKLRAV